MYGWKKHDIFIWTSYRKTNKMMLWGHNLPNSESGTFYGTNDLVFKTTKWYFLKVLEHKTINCDE